MKYILDFDRVLFDTDAFIARVGEEGLGGIPRGQALLDAIEDKGINWEEFVNKDALEFLLEHQGECVILSSSFSRKRGDNDNDELSLRLFQSEKINRCGVAKLVRDVIVVGENKEEKLRELYEQRNGDIVYLDDEQAHVEHAKEIGYKAVLMNEGKIRNIKGIEHAPVIPEFLHVHNFSEFSKAIESWKQEAA